MKKITVLFSSLMVVFMFSCSQSQKETKEEAKDSSETIIKAASDSSKRDKGYTETYQGTLPCADCSGIETSVFLVHKEFYAEGTYVLNQKYLGKPADKSEFTQKGEWTTDRGNDADPDATIVELFNVVDSTSYYYLRDGKNLLMLDKNMNEIKSKLNYTLKLTKLDSTIVATY